MSESVHGVLVNLPVFHDEIEILARVADEIEVLQWIAVDQDLGSLSTCTVQAPHCTMPQPRGAHRLTAPIGSPSVRWH